MFKILILPLVVAFSCCTSVEAKAQQVVLQSGRFHVSTGNYYNPSIYYNPRPVISYGYSVPTSFYNYRFNPYKRPVRALPNYYFPRRYNYPVYNRTYLFVR